MKDAKLVFSKDMVEFIFHISIGGLCEAHPNNIVDLSNSDNPKCVVRKEQLPDLDEECRELKNELMDWLEKDLVTCELAKRHYEDNACGELNCDVVK